MKLRVRDLRVSVFNDMLEQKREKVASDPEIGSRLWNLVHDKFMLGAKDKGHNGSTWGTFSAIVCMLRYLCYRDVNTATDVQKLVMSYGMGGNCNAENYVFGVEATFERTVPLHESLKPDYERVLVKFIIL